MDFEENLTASFKNLLFEALSVPNQEDGLGRRRHAMPQLTKFDDFMADLKANDIGTSIKSLDPASLTPTQGHFSEEKVDKLIDQKAWNAKPIISSSDEFVIDGHHRWLAAVKLRKDIQSRVIDMPAEKLLAFCKDKPYVQSKTINE